MVTFGANGTKKERVLPFVILSWGSMSAFCGKFKICVFLHGFFAKSRVLVHEIYSWVQILCLSEAGNTGISWVLWIFGESSLPDVAN